MRRVEAEVEVARIQVKEEAEMEESAIPQEEQEKLVTDKDLQQSLQESRRKRLQEMMAKNDKDTIASRAKKDAIEFEQWKKLKDQQWKEREEKQAADELAARNKEMEDAAADQALKAVEEIRARNSGKTKPTRTLWKSRRGGRR